MDGIKNFCNKKNTDVMIGTSNLVSDISENILAITEKRPSLENLIIHCGATDDVAKKKSEGFQMYYLLLSQLLTLFSLFSLPRSYTWPDSVSTCNTFLERGILQASAGNNLMLTLYR
ncbi:hypothetical protein CRENBAI_004515 [Crenichthys baileyi]|uniref:Uncharacterized protein n=1 Tax=Crenichthys baileyi TaxID=28760 RepID=A0AAV9R455_9TELE